MKPNTSSQIEDARAEWIKKKQKNLHYIRCTLTELNSYIVEVVLYNGKIDVVCRRYTATAETIDRLLYKISSEFRVFPNNIFGVQHGRFKRNDIIKPEAKPKQAPKPQEVEQPRVEATKQASQPAIEKPQEGLII
jgi:hypothetical protein